MTTKRANGQNTIGSNVLPVIPLHDRVPIPGLPVRVTLDGEDMIKLVRHFREQAASEDLQEDRTTYDSVIIPRFGSLGLEVRRRPPRYVLCVPVASGKRNENTEATSPPPTKEASNKKRGHRRESQPTELSVEEAAHETFVPYDGAPEWHRMACTARVVRIQRVISQSTTYIVVLQCLVRARVEHVMQTEPFPTAKYTPLPDPPYKRGDKTIDEQVVQLQSTARELLSFLKELHIPGSTLQQLARLITEAGTTPGELADLLAGTVDASRDDRLLILAAVKLSDRLPLVTELLTRQITSLKVSQKIHSTVEGNINKKQRELYLRQQLEAIKEELGEKDGDGDADSEIKDLQNRLASLPLPPEAQKMAERELKRLKRTPTISAEHQVIRTYLEWLTELPWKANTTSDTMAEIDLAHARQQLDDDHHGLEHVKRRILEHLAVMRLRRDVRGPIICLVGPPGVGKTSLGRSIAQALGRRFHRIALGGVRDEAEIRGHRRTYVGAMPGLIIQSMRKCGTSDPVLLLDEIDKVGQHSIHGDPSAALLEVLDPEQNHTFTDHYLNLPFDLSNVLFIATANRLDTIPPPLLDRMEVIELSGYTADEKLAIARRHLVPKQATAHGLDKDGIHLSDEVLLHIIHNWTRESGVRSLEREIAAVCRRAAVRRAEEGDAWDGKIEISDLVDILGPERYDDEVAARAATPGLATGLAYTQSGSGSIMFVECTRMPGSGKLTLTGKLGDVIKESAHIALSWLRTNAYALGLTKSEHDDLLTGIDVHVHCPAGATPKDGPSAGVTLAVALYSLFSGRVAPTWLAMTGEVTLRGLVMPVGGLKEKLAAAHRAGCRRVLVPEANKRQVQWEVPETVQTQLEVTYVATVWEALSHVFGSDVITPQQVARGHFNVASRL
jgi:ATP-dependent Lon protease